MSSDSALTDPPVPAVALVQIDERHALLFAEEMPDGLRDAELQTLLFATHEERSRLADAFSVSVGAAAMAANVAPTVAAVRGIVQLSPQTLAALQTMTPMVAANGQNLGVLVGAAGQFGHVVQWAPASGASAATFVATMGTSIALLAIQVQLAAISKKVDRSISLTTNVLEELRWASEAELNAAVTAVRRAYEEAVAIGSVTDEVYGELRGKEPVLDKARALLLRRVRAHSGELAAAKTREERRTWVIDHAEHCLVDLRALQQAQEAWFVFRAVRTANTDLHDSRLAGHLRSTTQAEHGDAVALLTSAADQLQRQLGLLEEGHRGLGRRGSAKRAQETIRVIRDEVLEAFPLIATSAPEPQVTLGTTEELSRASSLLPLMTGVDDQLMLVAVCHVDGYRKSFLFVLSDEMVLSSSRHFLKDHQLDLRIPLADIRYVRISEDGTSVAITTTQTHVSLIWADDDADTLAYANQLLASSMQLPVHEVPPVPIPPGLFNLNGSAQGEAVTDCARLTR